MLMAPNTEGAKNQVERMAKVDLNLTMGIFMKEHLSKVNEKGLEKALNIKKRWHMKENGRMTKGKDMEGKFGLIKVLFKASGVMDECNLEFSHGLMGVIIKESSLRM